MRVTIHHRGRTTVIEVSVQLVLGGDPASEAGIVANGAPQHAVLHSHATGWTLQRTGAPAHAVGLGDVLAFGEDRVVLGYRESPLPAAPLLDAVERALLSRVGAEGSDEHLRRVLADHWLTDADEPRGALVQQQCEGLDGAALIAEHGPRWRRTAIAAGFAAEDLDLRRGFAFAALVLERGEPLLACPDALRLSPRQYLIGGELASAAARRHYEVVARTLAGEHGRFVLRVAADPRPFPQIDRDAAVLARLDHPNIVQLFDLAMHREYGLGLVMPWAGVPLASRWREGVPDEALALALGLPLCAALSALADAAVVHQHLRADAVLVREDGHVTLAGFADASAPGIAAANLRESRGRVRNRFRHMSREQVRGMRLGPPTDVFSLAVLLATIAHGRHPLPPHDSDFDTLQAINHHRHVVPADTPLLRLLATAIVPDPDARPTAAELAAGLAALGAPDPSRLARLVAEWTR